MEYDWKFKYGIEGNESNLILENKFKFHVRYYR